jgi:hypothetical protein
VISALADRAEFLSNPDGGADVRMSFNRRGAGLELPERALIASAAADPVALHGQIVVSFSPVTVLAGVLGGLARAVAAGSHFTVDRLADLYPIADAIAEHAERAAAADSVTCAIDSASRRLQLKLAPFELGTSAELTADHGPLASLVDELVAEPCDGGELLRIVVVDRREPA